MNSDIPAGGYKQQAKYIVFCVCCWPLPCCAAAAPDLLPRQWRGRRWWCCCCYWWLCWCRWWRWWRRWNGTRRWARRLPRQRLSSAPGMDSPGWCLQTWPPGRWHLRERQHVEKRERKGSKWDQVDRKWDSFQTMSNRFWQQQSVSWMRFRKWTRSFSFSWTKQLSDLRFRLQRERKQVYRILDLQKHHFGQCAFQY